MNDNLRPTTTTTVLPRLDCREKMLAVSKTELGVDKDDCAEASFVDGRILKKKRFENKETRQCTRKESFSSSEESLVVSQVESLLKVGSWSHGSVSVIGRRREMEDAVAVELGFLTVDGVEYDFFGVYDGHGGSSVAHACRDRLHSLVVQAVEEGEEGEGVVDWGKVMVESFSKMDEEVSQSGPAVATMGSTAVVAVVGVQVVVVANCGDSRAVIWRNGAPVALSGDHKPDRPDELERIELSGGRVINWNGHRVLGVLTTSRSIGDHYLKPYIISEPEVIITRRTDMDEFLILASDGLWDVISNEIACQIVRRCLNGRMRRKSQENSEVDTSYKLANQNRAAEAAALLVELAIARSSNDNISVIVVELRKPGA